MSVENPEFSLHVHKISRTAQHDELYTIGLWRGTVLCGICHVQPIDHALAALRRVLEQAGHERAVDVGPKANDSIPDAPRNPLRHVGAVFWTFLASLIRVGR